MKSIDKLMIPLCLIVVPVAIVAFYDTFLAWIPLVGIIYLSAMAVKGIIRVVEYIRGDPDG